MANVEPEGDLVTGPPALYPDIENIVLKGQHVTLVPLKPAHFPDLYTNLGGPGHAHVWRYIPAGPFSDIEPFATQLEALISSPIYFAFAILSSDPVHLSNQDPSRSPGAETAISVITFMNIVPSNRCIEIGYVLFTPTLQRTTAATEINYLLMKWAFEEGHYMRVEWKTNNLNEPSKRAALRLGFTFEGIFRKHMVVKGRRRDTAWFSCLDEEWDGGLKAALEGWLDRTNFKDGKQVRKLEEFRESRKLT